MAWDKNKPAGSQKIRLSDEEIRANNTALEDALAREHTFPGVSGSTAGQHTPLAANLQKQLYTAAAAGGTVDAITATFDPALAALTDNTLVCVIAAGANLTTTPTFAPDGLTAKTIVKGSNQALTPGDILGENFPMILQYNSVLDKWVLMNPAAKDKFALLQNRRTAGTGGGATTEGAWSITPLNTEQEDPDGIVNSTSLPAFSLEAGTYRITGHIPLYNFAVGKVRLYNVTDAAVAIIGEGLGSGSYYYPFPLIGTITITATKQFRVEYYASTGSGSGTAGQGFPTNLGVEVYAQVEITKIA